MAWRHHQRQSRYRERVVPGIGNPKGRPPGGARLEADYVAGFAEHFAEHGFRAIVSVYQQDPARYLQLAGALLPKEIQLQLAQKLPGGLSISEWAIVTELVDAIGQALPDAGQRKPGDVLNHVLNALNAYAPPPEAKLVEAPKRI